MKARHLMLLWDANPTRNLLAVEHPPHQRHPQPYSAGACYSDWRGDSQDFAGLFADMVEAWGANPRQVLAELAKADDAPGWVHLLLVAFTDTGAES